MSDGNESTSTSTATHSPPARTPRDADPSGSISVADLACAFVLGVLALAWFSLAMGATLQPADEGYLMLQSARVAAGEVPHRDFVDVYGPGAFTTTGLVMRAFGEDVMTVRSFLAIVKALAVAFGFLLMRTAVPRSFAIGGALLATAFWGRVLWNLNAPYASLYTLALAPLGLLLLLRAARHRSVAGLVVAGAVAGLSILFKQSLAVFLVAGMGLALWGHGMLREAQGPRVRRETRVALAAWGLVGVALLVPLRAFLGGFEYALHVLPIHASMALVGLAVVRRGGTGALATVVGQRLLPFGAGAAAILAATASIYASMGALSALVDDMFVLPMTLANYHRPVHLPPAPVALLALAVLSGSACALLALAARRKGAVAASGVALLSLWLATRFETPDPFSAWLQHGPPLLAGLFPAAVAWAGLGAIAPRLLGGTLAARPDGLAILGLLFFHVFLAFQGYPRAGPDLFLAQGLQVGLLIFALSTFYERLDARRRGPAARTAIATALLVVPLWMAAEPVAGVLEAVRNRAETRALRLPRAEGVALPRSEFRRLHLRDTEQLVDRLDGMAGNAPVLLLNNEDLILFASGRRPLMARDRAHLFWIGWNLPSGRGRADLEDRILRRLEEAPHALVIESRDPSTGYLLEAFPRLERALRADYGVAESVGRHRILVRTRAQPLGSMPGS